MEAFIARGMRVLGQSENAENLRGRGEIVETADTPSARRMHS
jgi:hypothetical protein